LRGSGFGCAFVGSGRIDCDLCTFGVGAGFDCTDDRVGSAFGVGLGVGRDVGVAGGFASNLGAVGRVAVGAVDAADDCCGFGVWVGTTGVPVLGRDTQDGGTGVPVGCFVGCATVGTGVLVGTGVADGTGGFVGTIVAVGTLVAIGGTGVAVAAAAAGGFAPTTTGTVGVRVAGVANTPVVADVSGCFVGTTTVGVPAPPGRPADPTTTGVFTAAVGVTTRAGVLVAPAVATAPPWLSTLVPPPLPPADATTPPDGCPPLLSFPLLALSLLLR